MQQPTLHREIGLWRGVALNMIDMVGIGPFITIPLILTAMGGGRGMLAWVLGGLLAISDGLVTAELAAELPGSGGSYVFLREAYGRYGRVISFLFLFQICFSAPLSMASGCIGFANYLKILIPASAAHVQPVAMAICVVTTLLLLRRIGHIGKFSILLWIGVLGTLAIVIGVGLPHLKMSAFTFWNAPRVDQAAGHAAGYAGLGAALLYAVYDYLGYYNICYLGDEVQNPTKTIPRVIVISILAIGVIYLVMNACIVSVLPMNVAMTSTSVVGDYIAMLMSPRAAKWVSVLILWTAFASIFSLML
ncbi:MAG TPA: amino acid permease, partial [Thermoanaerobaculia bacterium]